MDEETLRRIVREELSRALDHNRPPVDDIPLSIQYLTVNQSAKVSGYHQETVTAALRLSTLHGAQRIKGARWWIRADCLEAWLESRPCPHAV